MVDGSGVPDGDSEEVTKFIVAVLAQKLMPVIYMYLIYNGKSTYLMMMAMMVCTQRDHSILLVC